MKIKSAKKALAMLVTGGLLAMAAGCGNQRIQADSTQTGSAQVGDMASQTDPESKTVESSLATEGTVKVGLLHSLTGSMAISEVSVRDAELLAIEEINAAGGVLGCQIVPFEEDGASDPSVFATKAEKLIVETEVATVFGCWTSSSRKAVKQIFEDYESLLWYPVQYEGMEASPNIMYMGAAPNQQIVPAIDYLADQGYTKFFLLGSDYVFPRTANMIIKAQVEDLGLTTVGEEYAAMDQTEFSSILAKIEEAQPDVIINTLNGASNVSFFKQLSEKNITSKELMTMSFSIAEEEVKTIGADILSGHLVSWNYYQTTEGDRNAAFVKSYKEKFGADRVTSDPAGAAYTAVYAWAEACEAAGSFDVEAVKAAAAGLMVAAPEGDVVINGDNQHLAKTVRIGQVATDGLIYEIYATDGVVEPDPYLTSYEWAVQAGIQPLE